MMAVPRQTSIQTNDTAGAVSHDRSAVESASPSGASSATNYLKDQIGSFFQVSDNKLAMKLFGNKNALLKEKMRQKAAGNWVIHPCSNFRLPSLYGCSKISTHANRRPTAAGLNAIASLGSGVDRSRRVQKTL